MQLFTVCEFRCHLEQLKLYPDKNELMINSSPVIEKYSYVMAPWKENVYARARILNTKKHKTDYYAYVHFIDEGHAYWFNMVCFHTLF